MFLFPRLQMIKLNDSRCQFFYEVNTCVRHPDTAVILVFPISVTQQPRLSCYFPFPWHKYPFFDHAFMRTSYIFALNGSLFEVPWSRPLTSVSFLGLRQKHEIKTGLLLSLLMWHTFLLNGVPSSAWGASSTVCLSVCKASAPNELYTLSPPLKICSTGLETGC